MQYLSVDEAKDKAGLKLVLSAGVPGPWGESLKAILAYKGIEYLPVRQEGGGENADVQAWTGQSSAPVLVGEGFPPVSHWLDQLHLAERLHPAPALLPEDMSQREQVLGMSALVVGVDGIGWNRRVQMIAPVMALDEPPEMLSRLAHKYGCTPEAIPVAARRLVNILKRLDTVLEQQQARGSDYFVGDSVTAVDFYWANFAAMFKPLPHDVNPMPDYLRTSYERIDEACTAAFTPRLERHRDAMYERHITLPLDF